MDVTKFVTNLPKVRGNGCILFRRRFVSGDACLSAAFSSMSICIFFHSRCFSIFSQSMWPLSTIYSDLWYKTVGMDLPALDRFCLAAATASSHLLTANGAVLLVPRPVRSRIHLLLVNYLRFVSCTCVCDEFRRSPIILVNCNLDSNFVQMKRREAGKCLESRAEFYYMWWGEISEEKVFGKAEWRRM